MKDTAHVIIRHLPKRKLIHVYHKKWLLRRVYKEFIKFSQEILWRSSGKDSLLSLPGTQVHSLVGELRSCKLCSKANNKNLSKQPWIPFFPEAAISNNFFHIFPENFYAHSCKWTGHILVLFVFLTHILKIKIPFHCQDKQKKFSTSIFNFCIAFHCRCNIIFLTSPILNIYIENMCLCAITYAYTWR